MRNAINFFLKYRPLSILAMAGGVRDILLGIGFIAGWGQIIQTLIYQNYNELIPGVSGHVAGILLVLAGIAILVGAVLTKRMFMVVALKLQAATWFFSTLMYVLNGHWLLAVVFGIFFCFPAAFTAFYVKNYPPFDQAMNELLRRD